MSWLKDYFSFTRKERTAFIILLLLIAGFVFLPDLFPPRRTAAALSADVQKELAATRGKAVQDTGETNAPYAGDEQEAVVLFYFDPNTLGPEGFIKLGLPERTARTIINYRSKGGRFRKAEDLRKIYSLRQTDADRIIPYVRIASAEAVSPYDHEKSKEKKNARKIGAIDINTATIEEWKSLPGIGDVLGARILAFRERLGGFASINQVSKTYGLRDSVFQAILPYLELGNPAVNKIDINTAFEKELAECSAITPDIAKAIIIYRKQHGPFQSIEDLKKIVFITEETFRSIAPCVKVK